MFYLIIVETWRCRIRKWCIVNPKDLISISITYPQRFTFYYYSSCLNCFSTLLDCSLLVNGVGKMITYFERPLANLFWKTPYQLALSFKKATEKKLQVLSGRKKLSFGCTIHVPVTLFALWMSSVLEELQHLILEILCISTAKALSENKKIK